MRNRKNGECLIRDEQGRKQCRTCDQWCPVTDYSSHPKTLDGLQVRCRPCVNKERIRTQYGVTYEQIMALYSVQGGACAVCFNELDGKFAVDHDHSCCSGIKACGSCVRGLLCHLCNLGLGSFKDNVASLKAAVRYLERAGQGVELEVPAQAHVPYLDHN